jgi:hypothetical protein
MVPAAESISVDTTTEMHVRGRRRTVPAVNVQGQLVAITGTWPRIASLVDENAITEGKTYPASLVRDLARANTKPDIFTFSQQIPNTSPHFDYPFEWDNLAVIHITSYEEWFAKCVSNDVKQNIRRAAKRGVVTRSVPFDDRFVQGIVDIYNETPIRQGRRFWHYGKDFKTVKSEVSHCLEKSEFIGSYCGDELIGFIKLLRMGEMYRIVLILSKQAHFDKKPTNALIAHAVQICASKEIPYLAYGKIAYGNKITSSLVDFKQRHGFRQVCFPKYLIPMTLTGRLAVLFKLNRGIMALLPAWAIRFLGTARSRLYNVGEMLRPGSSVGAQVQRPPGKANGRFVPRWAGQFPLAHFLVFVVARTATQFVIVLSDWFS